MPLLGNRPSTRYRGALSCRSFSEPRASLNVSNDTLLVVNFLQSLAQVEFPDR
jgi:hypothetical protein